MANRAAVECTDQLCRKLTKKDIPFGGIPFIAVGDFRQVSPVVKGNGCTPALLASIKSSYLWPSFIIKSLHTPIRSAADPQFTAIVDEIGEDYHHTQIQVPFLNAIPTFLDAVEYLYPQERLNNPPACLQVAFLSPLNKCVDEFNEEVLHRLTANEGTKISAQHQRL